MFITRDDRKPSLSFYYIPFGHVLHETVIYMYKKIYVSYFPF